MPAQANANVIALQLEKVRDKVPLLYERDDILLTMMQQRGDIQAISSRNMRLPLQVNPGGKAGSYNADGGDLGRGAGSQYDVAQVSPVFFRFAIEITKLAEYGTTGKERAIEDSTKREVVNGMRQFRSFLDKLMQTAGNGVLGTISTVSGPTFTMTVPYGAALVYPGQTIQIYDNTLTTNRNAASGVTTTVQTCDPITTQQIVVDNVPPGTVATDVIVHDGLTGAQPVSLYGIKYHQNNATTGTWLNLNRATYPVILATPRVNAGNAALTPANVRDLPRQYDDTNFDRVSQDGPGGAPTVVDENVVVGVVASPAGATQPAAFTIAASPAGATESGYLVTITTTTAHGLSPGQTVTIAGVALAAYNGTFTVVSVPSSTQLTYACGTSGFAASGGGTVASAAVTLTTSSPHGLSAGQLVTITGVGVSGYNGTFSIASVLSSTQFSYQALAGGLAASGGGTATAAGNVAPGTHQVCVIFQTRQGYLTKPGPAATWTASGGKRAVVTNIPTGPSNIVARILCFTGSAGATFYYVGAGASLFSGNMIISDNSTTSLVVDFSDAILLAGTSVDNLFTLVELGDCAGVIDYSERLFWWGERNKMDNWANLGFDGGFTGPALPHYPLGWTPDATFAPGGTDEESFVLWGAAYSMVGDGATATRGLMTQGAVKDSLGAPLISANTDYTVRARCARNSTLAQGTLHVHLYSASGAINTTGLQLTASQVGTSYAEYTAELTAPLATIPNDLVLRVYADGTPTLNGKFYVDCIEIAPTLQPVNGSLVRACRVEDPESYDGIDGIMSVAENNGQAIRSAFKLRERLYFVKEHSLHVTQDDGTNEPALWTISEVSASVGTPSVRGVGFGEDWVVIAHRTGLYLFSGGEPTKISQEIQPTWNTINWQYAQTMWVTVDTNQRRIYVGAPFGSATTPNQVLMLDYHDIDSASSLATQPPVNITYTGRKSATDNARKWSPWIVAANCSAMIERQNGTAVVAFGAGTPGVGGGGITGKIYQLSDSQYSDDGTAIDSYYTTYFVPERMAESSLGVGAHRKLFSYLTMYVEGAGNLGLTTYVDSSGAPTVQQTLPLSSPGLEDLELPINVLGERVAFEFSTSQAGAWFRLQRFTPTLQTDPWAPVRGGN